MAKPLFTKQEVDEYQAKIKELDRKNRDKIMTFDLYWAERQALERARSVETVHRAQARAEEYLNALIILVGKRGAEYVEFDAAFADSDDEKTRQTLRECGTPETRRALYTILRALTEVPRSWARSAFVRFLRGTGKQQGAKYHGAGTFGVAFGWKENEITAVCDVILGGLHRYYNSYSTVLMSYHDVADEVRESGDFEIVDADVEHKAVNVERDNEFLNKLCGMLEAKGLASVPAPAAAKPKKPHEAKIFKPGDVIRRRDLRDLPLPAHVRLKIEKRDAESNQWLADTIDVVVAELYDGGRYLEYRVGPDGKTAFASDWRYGEDKENLDGATYVGPWKGKTENKKVLKYKFGFRRVREG